MKTSLSGDPTTDTPIHKRQSAALGEERRQSDAGLEEERQLVDATLRAARSGEHTSPEDPHQGSVMDALLNRVRAQRLRLDARRRTKRLDTNTTMQLPHDAELDAGAAQRTEVLAALLAELDVIASAASVLRVKAFEAHTRPEDLAELSATITDSTAQVLAQLGALFARELSAKADEPSL